MKTPKLHTFVILTTNRGARYGGILSKCNDREVWLSKLLIFDKCGNLIAAPKSRSSRRFPIGKVENIENITESLCCRPDGGRDGSGMMM